MTKILIRKGKRHHNFQLIVAILNAVPKHEKSTVASVMRDTGMAQIGMDYYRVKSLVELLCERGYLESSGTFKEHEHNYLKLTYYGAQWLREINSFVEELRK
jgi:predicted transcriptional regulator